MKAAYRLSWNFEIKSLVEDLNMIDETWHNHFNSRNFNGEWSGIQLREPEHKKHGISPGVGTDIKFQNTAILDNCHYFRQIIAKIQSYVQSVRLLKLSSGSEIKTHKDPELSFFHGFVRLHIPITTNDKVEFIIDGEQYSMKPGECWFAEFALPHSVKNLGETDRVHLVIDIKTNDWLKSWFVDEGVLQKDEKAPNPIDKLTNDLKLDMVRALLAQKNETATEMAEKLIFNYNLQMNEL